ncbi:hypothetical protein AVEN_233080-1 [Araneus ventricosus]|uniref:Uncharacterized protein n=1 Tax=Araneus ventricosus TaxID=182803 RepID=A0A4Y2R5Y1_ARAVE|nr:hypothetical protein AVEN_233080-1 [Araneus ventricosus]
MLKNDGFVLEPFEVRDEPLRVDHEFCEYHFINNSKRCIIVQHQWIMKMTRTTPPILCSTPAGGRLTHYVRFSVQHAHIHGGSLEELGFEPGVLRHRK